MDIPYIVAVEPQEYDLYCEYIDASKVLRLGGNGLGLGYSLSQLKSYAQEKGFEYIFKIDDDIRAFRVKSAAREHAVKNFDSVLGYIKELLAIGFEGVGFGYGNMLQVRKLVKSVNPVFKTCYFLKLEYWKPSPKISTFEDFWATKNYREMGAKVALCSLAGFETLDSGKNTGVTKGGLQDFDRKLLAKQELKEFAKKGVGYRIKPDTPWYYEPIL